MHTQHIVFKMWDKIEKQLKLRDWSMYRLAKESGIHQSNFSNLKAGRLKEMSWTNMCKLADALEVSLDEFRLEVKIILLMQMLMLYMKFMQIILMTLSMQKIKSSPTRLTMKKYVSILKQVSGDV